MPKISANSKAEFFASLEQIKAEETTMPSEDVMAAFRKAVPDDDFTVTDLNELVDFSLEQTSQWQVRWLFSPANAPDTLAQTESQEWERLWKNFADGLATSRPEVETLIHKRKDLVIAQRIMQRKVEQDSYSSVTRIQSLLVSGFAQMLNRVGFRSIATRLYAMALYPAGTVGRAQILG